jgi:uncharacterized protein (TIGR03067 family)
MAARLMAVAVAVLAVAFAPAPLPRRGQPSLSDELKRLQGTWVRESHHLEGLPLSAGPEYTVEIEGDRLRCVHSGKMTAEWRLLLDPKDRGIFDLQSKDGSIVLGIYRLEGDTLTHCYRNSGAETRPVDFTPRAGVGVEVMRKRP